MSKLIKADSLEEIKKIQSDAGKKLVVLYFWGEWHEPCKHLTSVVETLAEEHINTLFLKIDVDGRDIIAISKAYPVRVIPTIICTSGGVVLGQVEGFQVQETVALIEKHIKSTSSVASNVLVENQTESNEKKEEILHKKLDKLINLAPIMLFMKGTPDQPRCGFSKQMIAILNEHGAQFSSMDILSDNEVREGLKKYKNWPTYPQLYVNGELIGGLDVVKDMVEIGEFAELISSLKRSKDDLNERLKSLINSSKIMLFMKGNPEEPRCGFSRKAIDLLKSNMPENANFGSFDILSDNEVREGLKAYSNWPTYPQLYVNGELIGGLDVLNDLADVGELKDMLSS